MTADGAGGGAEQRLNPVLPAQLLVQTADEHRVGLNDAIGDVVLLAVDLVLVGDDQHVRPLVGAVVEAGAAFTGKGQYPLPVIADPHGCDLLLKYIQLFPVELLTDPGQNTVPGVQLQWRNLHQGHECHQRSQAPSGNLAAGERVEKICDGQWNHPLSSPPSMAVFLRCALARINTQLSCSTPLCNVWIPPSEAEWQSPTQHPRNVEQAGANQVQNPIHTLLEPGACEEPQPPPPL